MFVYLFVWETLGIHETPAGDQRHHRKPAEVALGAFRYNHIKAEIKSLRMALGGYF